MENEIDNYLISTGIEKQKDIDNDIDIFIPEYKGQNLKNNISFLNWKKLMLIQYGENAKIFKCIKDNILYCTSFNTCISYPIYQSKCPKCKNNICFYCSRNINDYFNETGTCCLKRKIKCIFYQDCYRYINPIIEEENINSFTEALFLFITPITSLLNYIEHIQGIFYYKLATKESRQYIKVERYFDRLKDISCIEIINVLIQILLLLPLFIIHIYFIIFLILISIPFKFVPLKYFLGIHFATI